MHIKHQTTHELNKALFDSIQSRPSRMTDVLQLRAAGLTYAEIAAQTGLTKNNVAQYLHRAKQRYSNQLGSHQ